MSFYEQTFCFLKYALNVFVLFNDTPKILPESERGSYSQQEFSSTARNAEGEQFLK